MNQQGELRQRGQARPQGLEHLVESVADARTPTAFAREFVRHLVAESGAEVACVDVEGVRPEGVFTHVETRSGREADAITRIRAAETDPPPDAFVHPFDLDHVSGTVYLQPVRPDDRRAVGVATSVGLRILDLLAELAISRIEAAHDPLTGLPNRRFMDLELQRFTAAANRYADRRFSVVMLDLDNFKRFNDTHGHPVGDALLREIGALLRDSVRKSDLAGRWGGDEFLLLLPETDEGHAAVLLDRLTRDVERVADRFRRGVPVGLSSGLASFPEDGQDPETLVRVADERLYLRKPRRGV